MVAPILHSVAIVWLFDDSGGSDLCRKVAGAEYRMVWPQLMLTCTKGL